MKIKNLMMLFLVSCLGLNTLVSVRASDDEDYPFNIEDDSLNSDGEYYEYASEKYSHIVFLR